MYYEKHRGRIDASAARRIRLLAALVLAAAVLVGVDLQFRRVIADAASLEAQNRFSQAVSEAVLDLTRNGHSFDVVTVSENSSGDIVSVRTDTGQINMLKGELDKLMLERFSCDEWGGLELSLGTMSGIRVLSGRGPLIALDMELCGGLITDVKSEFAEAGINQTLHRLYCTVSAEFRIVMPGQRFTKQLTTVVPIAESVIVGDVPEAYTYVIGDRSDTVGRIFDYGAEQ